MQNQNSVAFVAKIDSVVPIPGADNIEQAFIGGWSCIIKKDSHKAGELVICATTDAVIPQELSEAMGVTSYLRSGTRVRTVKLRGVYSECLIIPTHFVKGKLTMGNPDLKEGQDLMETLGIFKYEPAIQQVRLASGKMMSYKSNSNFGVYYKFPNQKNVKNMFKDEDLVEITRKLHGTNARYGIVRKHKLSIWDRIKKFFHVADEFVGYEYVIGSHNREVGSDSNGYFGTNVWFDMDRKLDIKGKLWKYVRENLTVEELGSGITLYGEIYGPGIQKNYDYNLADTEFAAFDMVIDGTYMAPMFSQIVTVKLLELEYVPVLYVGAWSKEVQDHFVIGNFIDGTKIPHEGVVVKYATGQRNKVSKVINPDYLIYGEKHDVGDSH